MLDIIEPSRIVPLHPSSVLYLFFFFCTYTYNNQLLQLLWACNAPSYIIASPTHNSVLHIHIHTWTRIQIHWSIVRRHLHSLIKHIYSRRISMRRIHNFPSSLSYFTIMKLQNEQRITANIKSTRNRSFVHFEFYSATRSTIRSDIGRVKFSCSFIEYSLDSCAKIHMIDQFSRNIVKTRRIIQILISATVFWLFEEKYTCFQLFE